MVKRKKRNIITWLLSSPYGILRPNQFGISLAFESAAKNNHRDIMEWLLTRTAGIPLPNQESVCSAFSKAAENNHRGIMEWLLTQPEGLPLPNQSTINFIYINLCAQQPRTPETENILRIMDPLVPEQERINQGRAPRQIVRDQGMSGEIHGYSNTMVPGFCDSGRTSPSENQRLFDLVLNQIETRIQGFPRNDIDTILTRLSAIDRIYVGQPEQLNIAQQALAYGLDEAAHFHLQKVLTFLDTLSPHAFDLWFKGFMDESITAYINSQHKLSCAKGIQERILTGLRGVDPGLGQIFKHAEAPLLMKNYINKHFNLYDESVQRAIATMLKQKGIHAGSTVDDAQSVLQNHLMQQLRQYEIEIPADIQESVRVIVEVFGDIYDEKIKPLL